jgi:hypothetical protein
MDLSGGIKAAMAEAKVMVGLGKEKVKKWQDVDQMDNSRDRLFLGAEEEHFLEAERTYNTGTRKSPLHWMLMVV